MSANMVQRYCDIKSIVLRYLLIFFFLLNMTLAVTSMETYTAYPCGLKNDTNAIEVHCNGGNLAQLSVAFRKFWTIPIERIVLNSSQIGTLYGNLFANLNTSELHILNTGIHEIEENVLLGLKKALKVMHIINSNLEGIPSNALNNTKLKQFILSGSSITTLKKADLNDWQSELEKLSLTNSKIEDIESGTFLNSKKLKYLDLHGNSIQQLKKSQFQGLREVDYLDISFNSLLKLETTNIGDLGKLSILNVSHNSLTEISRGAFAKNSVLKVLDLSHNHIKRLDSYNFRGMRFLRRIYLSDNNISEINRGTFGSIRRIGTIDLARNAITKIDFEMFSELQYVEIIDVSNNRISHISKQSFKDLYLAAINMSYNEISNIEVGAFENCVNLTLIDMSHNNISRFYDGAFDANSYAGVFDLSYNYITNLSFVPLGSMAGLRIFNISFNKVKSIPKQTNLKLHELAVIDISHNELSEIADGILQQAISLRFLNLSYNELTNIRVSTIGAITALLELDLSNNKLVKVHREAFMKLASLGYVTLDDNQLTEMIQPPLSLSTISFKRNKLKSIRKDLWPSMNSLLTLDITSNELNNNFESENFAKLLTLRKLYLTNNNISEITKGTFGGLSSLQYLGLDNNNLTWIEKDMFGRLPVFDLNLSNNNIKNISNFAFQSLITLTSLNLSSNKVATLTPDTFKGLTAMQILDLSKNMVEKLNNGSNSIFDHCLSLKTVYLQNNNISFIPKKSFPFDRYSSYNIENIDLSYNTINFIARDFTYGREALKYLNLAHNNLQEIREESFKNLPSLIDLNLSLNKLEGLHLNSLPINLSYLNVSWNNIRAIWSNETMNTANRKLALNLENSMQSKKLFLDIKENPAYCNCSVGVFEEYIFNDTHNFNINELLCHENISGNYCQELAIARMFQQAIKFKAVKIFNGLLWVAWKVTGEGDIADFYFCLREISTKTIIKELNVPYDARSLNVSTSDLLDYNDMEACLFTKTSEGFIKHYIESQCFRLGQNWKSLHKQCLRTDRAFCNLYDPKIGAFVSNTGSYNLGNQCNFILITLFTYIYLVLQ